MVAWYGPLTTLPLHLLTNHNTCIVTHAHKLSPDHQNVYRVLHCQEGELTQMLSTLGDGWKMTQVTSHPLPTFCVYHCPSLPPYHCLVPLPPSLPLSGPPPTLPTTVWSPPSHPPYHCLVPFPSTVWSPSLQIFSFQCLWCPLAG